jgi:hypothetical protein
VKKYFENISSLALFGFTIPIWPGSHHFSTFLRIFWDFIARINNTKQRQTTTHRPLQTHIFKEWCQMMPISSIFPNMHKQTQTNANIYTTPFLKILSDFYKNPIGFISYWGGSVKYWLWAA